jgi:hypothetical protein
MGSDDQVVLNNSYATNGIQVTGSYYAGFAAIGGVLGGFPTIPAGVLDADVILATSIHLFGGYSNVGRMFIDGNIHIDSGVLQLINGGYGGPVIYGRAGQALSLHNQSHVRLASGTFVAGLTAPGIVSGVQLNGSATGCTHTSNNPDIVSCGVNTTPTNLDAAPSGNTYNPGGASIANFN